MADSAGRSVCRTCKTRPRAPGKMRCQTCIDLARVPNLPLILRDDQNPEPLRPVRDYVAELEQQVQDLEAELAEERSRPRTANEALADILPSMLDRAKNKGDVQAAKFIMEHARIEREEALAGRGKTIDDFIVPAGTNLDPDPKEAP